jgi:hypothetical protein
LSSCRIFTLHQAGKHLLSLPALLPMQIKADRKTTKEIKKTDNSINMQSEQNNILTDIRRDS